MKLATFGLLALSFGAFGQGISLSPPPAKIQVLNEYVENFPASGFTAGAVTTVSLSKPPLTGTIVTVYLEGYTPFVTKSVVKTAAALTVSLNAEQVASGASLVVVYKSDK